MEDGLTLELLSAADICLRAGQNLCKRYKDIRGVHRDVDDLNIRVENVWIHIAYQLATIQSSSGALPSILRKRAAVLLDELRFCLHTAYRNLEKVTDKNGKTAMKTLWFALFQKRSLEKDVLALETWRDAFSTFSSHDIDTERPEPDPILPTGIGRDPQPASSADSSFSNSSSQPGSLFLAISNNLDTGSSYDELAAIIDTIGWSWETDNVHQKHNPHLYWNQYPTASHLFTSQRIQICASPSPAENTEHVEHR
ncbi:hypothetical protein C7212DRAFT_341027 [Tuber magnatum]|uniref:Fungal N-terminal domain-containing protein n=1 Tax=Tuber magnatum TaxID=42249 RepID=A0A317T611_9PEZI|nr:hypothetical protein C7212DRAFT_341027 [Tuber magnatum]